MEPIIFDLINGVVLQVGRDAEADKRYAEIVAAQQQATVTSGASPDSDS